MERARVLCPSISLAVHAAGLGTLMLWTLLAADRLPVPGHGGGFAGLAIDPTTVAHLGGPPAGGANRREAPIRAETKPPRFVAPTRSAAIVGTVASIDLDAVGIPGLPDDLPAGNGTGGVCLVGCGSGDGDGAALGAKAVFPAVERPAPVRAGQGGQLREPRKLRHVAPVYPPLALAAHVQGRVVLDCVIDEDGRIGPVTVLGGNPLLEPAAVEAVRQWRYTPTLLNGVRISVLLTVTVDFTLR